MKNITPLLPFVFFGTPVLARIVLQELQDAGLTPLCVVCAPTMPKGRGLQLTPSEAELFATKHHIPIFTPTKLDDAAYARIKALGAKVGVVAAYGKLIPQRFIELFPSGLLNVHPSLLPKFRGASPIQSTILSTEITSGVTIMLIDEKLDHGPIVEQKEVPILNWPPKARELENTLAHAGGKLLATTLPLWVEGKITAISQDETQATFTHKIVKENGLLDMSANPHENLKKIRAYDGWPTAYFFITHEGNTLRIKILDAEIVDGKLEITRVLPEGKKEMSYPEFTRGLRGSTNI